MNENKLFGILEEIKKYLNYANGNLRDNDNQQPYLKEINNNLFAIKKQNEYKIEQKYGTKLEKQEDGSWEYVPIKEFQNEQVAEKLANNKTKN